MRINNKQQKIKTNQISFEISGNNPICFLGSACEDSAGA
jgi:hypothetical protein